MDREIFFQKLAEFKENTLLKISSWGENGFSGLIITNNNEVYKYQYLDFTKTYQRAGDEDKYINKIKDLTEDELKKIISFMENNILTRQYTYDQMYDYGCNVEFNYNDIRKEMENDNVIYRETKNFLEELLDIKDI